MNDHPSSSSQTPRVNPLWGGRFSAGPAQAMEQINASIDFDKRLYAQDIAGSKAHCAMLVAKEIISRQDGEAISSGLDAIQREIENGTFVFEHALEDIHMNIESRLAERIGDAAGRLHTARSRNDQVATDLRLWLRDAIDSIDASTKDLQRSLLARAEDHVATVMPGFTHLQVAQPVTFGHHIMAYVEMFGRDRERFADCRKRVNVSPLGAGALAGTSFPIDRAMTAKELGFSSACANSMDGVSDRDFVVEFLSGAAICISHMARLAEEIVLWSSDQFGFVSLAEEFTTGSSIMPQKRNPDGAELVRGKSGRVIGALVSLFVAMKALPLTYAKDMQEDKEPLFDSVDSLSLCIQVVTGMIESMTINTDRMAAAAEAGYSTATDLADWLVRSLGLPFREAHGIVGRVVRLAEERGCSLADLPLDDVRQIEPRLSSAAFDVLRVEDAVASRTSFGGTAPERVREAIAAARARYL